MLYVPNISASEEFAPTVKAKVKLDDLGTWNTDLGENRSVYTILSPTSIKSQGNCHACHEKDLSHQNEYNDVLGRDWYRLVKSKIGSGGRPSLVSTDDFRDGLVKVAQSIISNKQGLHAELDARRGADYLSKASPESTNRTKLDVDPLIEALHKAIEEQHSLNEPATVPPIPTAEPCEHFSSSTPRLLELQSPPPQSNCLSVQTFPEVNSTDVPATILSVKDQLRLVRILEKISARKILKVWRKYYQAKNSKKAIVDTDFKNSIRNMAESALMNSMLIRNELVSIRERLNQSTQLSVVQVPPTPQFDNTPMFKSARFLLGPNVKSPLSVDKLIDGLTGNGGRNAIRLCSAQHSIHPKAFVIVVSLKSITVEEWKSRLLNNEYIYAFDAAFPFFQTTQNGVPWEIRVREDMATLAPLWTQTNLHSLYNSSGG